jgi:hypothetical protein
MRQRHPDEEEPAQGIKFGTAFKSMQHHPFPSERPGEARGDGRYVIRRFLRWPVVHTCERILPLVE